LIKQEKMPNEMLLPSTSQGIRFLYSSTSSLEPKNLVAVSGALFLPKGEPPKKWMAASVLVARHGRY
jgi:hypothetical protein